MSKIETGFAGQTLSSKILYFIVRNIICGFTLVYTRVTIEIVLNATLG